MRIVIHPITKNDRLLPSLAFWACLFVAAGLFAGVVLAPKLMISQHLAERHYELSWRLSKLERTNRSLERVVAAFQADPEFAAEVARLDFDAGTPGEQRLAAEPVGAFAAPPEMTLPANNPPTPAWWRPALDILATDRKTRNIALVTAAGLVITAFGLFPPPSER